MKKPFGYPFLWLIFLLLTSLHSHAQGIGKYIGYELQSNGVDINGEKGTLRIEKAFEGVLRVSTFLNNQDPIPVSEGIATEQFKEAAFQLSVVEEKDQILISDLSSRIEISKDPVRLKVFRENKLIFSELEMLSKTGDTTTLVVSNNTSDEIQGSGARPFDLNFQGKVMNMRNTYQGNYYENATGFEQSINTPLLFNSHKYALLFDSELPGRVRFDIGGFDSTRVVFRSIGVGDWSYYLILGENNDEIISNYTTLTGRQPLPPRWAFGVLQSKQFYRSTQEVVNIVNTYDRVGFPLDAVFLDYLWQKEMGDLRFDENAFENVETLIENNRNLGVKTVLRLDPLVSFRSRNFPFVQSNGLLATSGSSSFSSFFNRKDTTHVLLDIYKDETKAYLKQNLEVLERQGVSGWWSENNEPNHVPNTAWVNGNALEENRNWYSHEWAKAISESTQSQERLFHLSRSAYVGSQRYGVIPRSGDVTRYWAGLKLQIPIMLHAGLSGLAYMHSDIGGFATDPTKNERDDELDLRWLQMSVFSPIVRFHGLRNTTDLGRISNPFLSAADAALKMRYKLMPYIYSLAYQNSQTGRPFCLPSNYFENSERLKNRNGQYYFGENLLVAPVLLHGQPIRRVDLPSGRWFNFWTGEAHEGGKGIFQDLEIETIPVYAKAGAIIPLAQNDILHLEDYQVDSLEVLFFQDPSASLSSFEMYNDDGESQLSENTGAKIYFSGVSNDTEVSLKTEFSGVLSDRDVTFILYKLKNIKSIPTRINVNSRERQVVFNELQMGNQTAYYDIINQEIQIGVNVSQDEELIINVQRNANDILLSSKLEESLDFKASPNPTSHSVTLQFSAALTGSHVVNVNDLKGTQMQSLSIDVKEQGVQKINLNLSTSPAGVYLLQLINPSGKQTATKVIKI